MDEGELIQRVRDGDGHAFGILFDEYAARFEGHLKGRIPRALKAKISLQDVQQEARLVAFRRIADFEDRGPGSFGAWVSRILEIKLQEMIRHYRDVEKRAAGREVPREGPDGTLQLASPTPTPSQWAIAAELRQAADRAFQKLPEDYREVIRLVRQEQIPLHEVAERFGRTLEATKKLSARAIARFAELLREERGE